MRSQCEPNAAHPVPTRTARRKEKGTCVFRRCLSHKGFRRREKVAAVGFEPTTSATNPLGNQPIPPADQFGCTHGCTSTPATPPSAPPDLLQLLAQLAALPADQRAMLSRLLNPPTPTTDAPVGLDDSLPRAFERLRGDVG